MNAVAEKLNLDINASSKNQEVANDAMYGVQEGAAKTIGTDENNNGVQRGQDLHVTSGITRGTDHGENVNNESLQIREIQQAVQDQMPGIMIAFYRNGMSMIMGNREDGNNPAIFNELQKNITRLRATNDPNYKQVA